MKIDLKNYNSPKDWAKTDRIEETEFINLIQYNWNKALMMTMIKTEEENTII